ncbi:GntR family transcriptional regulator [Amycolatopsis ultiminotia]|uniref:GntR family transcriptional regulator n=1 Tax=Amycolatopsis ultiminotia TaxID=543629 RepID=A0ABP6V1G4_9PSEU
MTTTLHGAIAEDLRERIRDGRLEVGGLVPSESELCEQWKTSRAPVRQALATLRSEGVISGGRGRRSTVNPNAIGQPFDTLMSYSAWVRSLGRTPGQRTLELALRPADTAAAAVLDIEEGALVVQGLRLRLLDGVPVMLERATYLESVGRLLFDFDSDSGSQWEFLQGRGVEFAAASHTIDAVAADEIDAAQLDVSAGTPLLRQRRTARDPHGVVIEHNDDRYLPTEIAFTLENAPNMRTPLVRRAQPGEKERE